MQAPVASPLTPLIRASQICANCGCTLTYVQTGGRKPEVVAMRWEVISTMYDEGYKVETIAPLVGLSVRTCTNYLEGKVQASRGVVVRDVMLDGVKKVLWNREER